MFKRIFGFLKRGKDFEEERLPSEVELSKIDKHMNFMLRDKLGVLNKIISEKVIDINTEKEEALTLLRGLHKKPLMNPNISPREIQIMEGNRENYIKRISHFLASIDIPKNYLETHEYCIKFSQDMEQLFKEVQKNTFVLKNFFDNEITKISKQLSKIEQLIIDIRVTFEKNDIETLKEMQIRIKEMTTNLMKIESLKSEIENHKNERNVHEDKLKKLNERISTITSGTDYRMLESFKEDKDKLEEDIEKTYKPLRHNFSGLESSFKKYSYLNQNKKIMKGYLDDSYNAFVHDEKLEISTIIEELKTLIEQDAIGLKDKKKEHALDALNTLTYDYLKNTQAELHKLETEKHKAQTKITHNSAALNLSEQQYWINTTRDKTGYHDSQINKLQKDIDKIMSQNEEVKTEIKEKLQKLTGEDVVLKDDLHQQINTPLVEEKKG